MLFSGIWVKIRLSGPVFALKEILAKIDVYPGDIFIISEEIYMPFSPSLHNIYI